MWQLQRWHIIKRQNYAFQSLKTTPLPLNLSSQHSLSRLVSVLSFSAVSFSYFILICFKQAQALLYIGLIHVLIFYDGERLIYIGLIHILIDNMLSFDIQLPWVPVMFENL